MLLHYIIFRLAPRVALGRMDAAAVPSEFRFH